MSTTMTAAPIRVTSDADVARFCALAGGAALAPDALTQSGADASWMIAEGDAVVARCSLWWRAVPPSAGAHVGLIGHYAAIDARAGVALLRRACAELAARGCARAVGPLDGDTQHAYRLVTERGEEPPFFLEPDTPDAYPVQWAAAGFAPVASYYSALQDDLGRDDPRMPAIEARLAARGVTVRPLDLAQLDDELRRIHKLVRASFEASPFFAPTGEAAFAEQYRQLVPFVVPELVLLAGRAGQTIGLLFVVPDWLQARRGEPVTALVLKTLAVLPEYAGTGLAGLLIARGLHAARALGYTRVIHALMHEHNASLRLSGRFAGRVIRRYALFGREVTSYGGGAGD